MCSFMKVDVKMCEKFPGIIKKKKTPLPKTHFTSSFSASNCLFCSTWNVCNNLLVTLIRQTRRWGCDEERDGKIDTVRTEGGENGEETRIEKSGRQRD